MKFAARITGIGSAFPEKRLTNDDISYELSKIGVETNHEWIKERTGISERRISNMDNPDDHNSSLGMAAATKALEMSGRQVEDIEQIIYATSSPDTLIPSTACWLQHKIGATRAWGMDINAACSGFIYGLAIADQFIQTGHAKTILVVGADVLSQIVNWEDRTSCILFGDGAGAAIVEAIPPNSSNKILSTHLFSDGNLWKLLHIPAGGSSMEVTPERYEKKLHKIQMNGKEIFKVAVRTLVDFALRALETNNFTVNDLDWFVPHQANRRIIDAVVKRLEIPMDKVLINVHHYGNTSAATIPTILDQAVRDERIKKGQLLLLDAFGGGLTYGSILLRW